MQNISILKSIILGAVQGATEFLPISSSGHLVLAQHFFGVRMENGSLLAFNICLHFGTLLAIVVYFWRDLVAMSSKLFWLLVIGTIPAGIVGVFFKDFFEDLAANPQAAAVMLLVTGAILFATRFVRRGSADLSALTRWQAVLIGCAQAIAIIPGISRSGSTIATGLFGGITRDAAARFSFFLAIPAMFGAMILGIEDLRAFHAEDLIATIIGTLISFIVGLGCIKWLLAIVRKGQLWWFAFYCWGGGLLALVALS